jgi:hypothetical protein
MNLNINRGEMRIDTSEKETKGERDNKRVKRNVNILLLCILDILLKTYVNILLILKSSTVQMKKVFFSSFNN